MIPVLTFILLCQILIKSRSNNRFKRGDRDFPLNSISELNKTFIKLTGPRTFTRKQSRVFYALIHLRGSWHKFRVQSISIFQQIYLKKLMFLIPFLSFTRLNIIVSRYTFYIIHKIMEITEVLNLKLKNIYCQNNFYKWWRQPIMYIHFHRISFINL